MPPKKAGTGNATHAGGGGGGGQAPASPPPRRASRNRARVSYKQMADMEDSDYEPEEAEEEAEDEEDEFSSGDVEDDDDSDDEEEESAPPSKRGGGEKQGRGRGGKGGGLAAAKGGGEEEEEEEEEGEEEEDFAELAGLEEGDEFYFQQPSTEEEEGDDEEEDDEAEEEDEEGEDFDYERGEQEEEEGGGAGAAAAASSTSRAAAPSIPVMHVPPVLPPGASVGGGMLEYVSMTRAFEEVGARGVSAPYLHHGMPPPEPLIFPADGSGPHHPSMMGGGGLLLPFPDHVAEMQRLTQRRGRKRPRRGGRWSAEAPPGPKKKKKKLKGATGGRVMPEALGRVFGEAQRYYMRAEYGEALRLLNEMVRQAPSVPEPYRLIGQIYEDQRDLKKAAEVNLVGCQFGPKDAALWKKTGQMFLELGRPYYMKAQYCFGRAIKLNSKDVEAIADRAHVWSVWGKPEKAIYGYEQALRLSPPQPEVYLLRLAEECLRDRRHWEKGFLALGEVLCRTMGALFVAKQLKFLPLKPKAERHVPTKKMDLAYEAASALVRHLMATKRFDQAAAVVQALHLFVAKLRERQTRFDDQDTEQQLALPLDLVVRFGVCQLHLDRLPSALQCFAALRQRDAADPETAELLEEVASAFMATGKYFRALELLKRLDSLPPPSSASASAGGMVVEGRGPVAAVRVKLKAARSYLALGQHKNARPLLDQVDAACTTASHVVVPSTDAHAAAATVAAAREATSLRAWAARLGKDQGAITASLAAVTRLLDAAMAAGAADVAVGVKGAVADAAMGLLKAGRRRPYYYRAVYPSSHGVGAGGEGAAAAAPAAAAPAAAEEQKAAKEEEAAELLEEEEEQATSVDLAAVEVELCLEWALLSREAGKRQDFVSAALALVELAVYQSKSEFRRARKKRRRHHTESLNAGGPGVEEEEGEGEEDEEAAATTTAAGVANSAGAAAGGTAEGQGAPASNANVVPELVARSWERTRRQAALEAHVKVYFQRVEVLPLLGEPRVFEVCRAAAEACVEAGLLREGTDLVRAIVRRKKLLTPQHAKELQDLLLTQAVNEDDYTSAIKSALVGVAAEPHRVELANALGRMVRKASRDDVSRAVIRRMASKQADSVPLHMLSGNAFSLSRNYQMALDRFLAAYRLQPDEPLVSLAAAAVLSRVVAHRKVVDRHGCLVRTLAFLERYATLRQAQAPEEFPPSVVEAGAEGEEEKGARRVAAKAAMEQEAMYNVGRALHQAGLGHAAVHLYQDALDVYERHRGQLDGLALGGKDHVTREAAYNLCALYQAAGSADLARVVAERYLRVD